MSSVPYPNIAALAGEIAQAPQQQYFAARQNQASLATQAQETKLREGQITIQQQQIKDQQAMTQAMQEWNGQNIEDLPGLVIKHGASANAVIGLKNSIIDQKTKLATLGKDQLEQQAAQHDQIAGALSPGIDPKQVADADLPNWIRSTAKDLMGRGLLDPQHEQTAEQLAGLPPDQARQRLDLYRKEYMSQSQLSNEAAKAAEAKQNQSKALLDAAQAEAANYKEDPNLGLIDLRTKQPVNSAGQAPLTAQEAAILGKNEGDQVPLKLKNTANEIMNRGIRITSANGRQLMVDSQGNTVKDLGTAPAVTTFNLQNAGINAQNGQPSEMAKAIAAGEMKWQDVVSARTPMKVKEDLLRQVKQLKPDFNSGDFSIEQAVRKEFTSGDAAKNLTAFSTAIEHAKQLQDASDALSNGDMPTLNKIGNALGYQFGSDKMTNFNVIKNALSGEISKVFKGGQATDAEIREVQAPFSAANSPEQLKGAISNAIQLMNSKRDALKAQYEAGSQGKPNFGGGNQGTFSVKAPNGKTYNFKDQQSLNNFKATAGIQ